MAKEAARWALSPSSARVVGTRFFRNSEWYRFVAYTTSKKVVAVRESDCAVWELWGNSQLTSILKQVAR